MTELPHELVELADLLGVATDYWDWQGQHVDVPRETIEAVLTALGIDTSTDEAVAAALEERRLRPWRRMLAPCTVTRSGRPYDIRVHVAHGAEVRAWVHLEDGARVELDRRDVWVDPIVVDGREVGAATFIVPGDLPLGWHRVHAQSDGSEADSALVVTPGYLGIPPSVEARQVWGFMTQLYSVRSRRSWGLGDLADLAELASWSGRELGAGFVLVNPLHAAEPIPPMEPSPYLPVTRRFVNPVYLRVEDIPEYSYLTGAALEEIERIGLLQRITNESRDQLDRDAVWGAKRTALAMIHAVPRAAGREANYQAFLAREGEGLVDFATWCALAERHGLAWDEWPEELQDPRSPSVEKARAELAERVVFFCWLQWVVDEQLGGAQRAATEAGMPLGIVHDLAVGVHPVGADTWALQDVLARGVNVGAPADAFNQQGQDWSQPPWRPDALAELAYGPYRDMVRTILRHAGGIRVDHVIGLFRLWWVPQGSAPSAGTYVRYDHEALVGILALEAYRSGALVVGEDLGTVEPWVRDYLADRGILGTSILWFEKDHGSGRILRPEEWRELCLGTVTTHDLPPTAGYLAGEHIRIRHELGLLTRPVEEERRIDAEDRVAWLRILREVGLLEESGGKPAEEDVVRALHGYLARTPCRLVGVALPDAVGDRRAMNQPGTNREYPNWSLPLADGTGRPVLLEEVVASERAKALAAMVDQRRGTDDAG